VACTHVEVHSRKSKVVFARSASSTHRTSRTGDSLGKASYESKFLYEVFCAFKWWDWVLPDALIVPSNPKTDEGRGCEQGKQAEPHHGARIVFEAISRELAKE
jgi:hypothetical protein